MARALALLLVPALAAAARPIQMVTSLDTFTAWCKEHGKTYTGDEFARRQATFEANSAFIEEYNRKAVSHTLAVNKFADLTLDEFKNAYLGKKAASNGLGFVHAPAPTPFTHAEVVAPKSVDWRTKGAVTDVKNQGQCGSCWAFSTTGSVEGAWQIAGNDLVALSEQELVDCDTAHDHGCNGGLMDYAFAFVETEGLTTETIYPYSAVAQTCDASEEAQSVAKISSFADVPPNDEQSLKKAVAMQPVSVAIEADQQAFQFYSSGVFDAACGTSLDHGVLAVGYGQGKSGDDKTGYWIVKNSWGATWGEEGYIRLAMGLNSGAGQCGIAMQPSYPIV